MAVSSEVARVVHTANGTAKFFSYAPMDGVTSANLKVYLFNPTTGVLTAQTLGTNYTFGSGGVTFNTAPPSGWRVILLRQVELLQPDIYKTNAPFPAVVTEKRLDEIVKGLQQINDVVQNRSIILPLSDAGFSNNVLPAVENRKGRVLYFNATTGDPEAKMLVDATVTTFPAWADSFLFQPSAAAGLADIGAVAKAGDTMTGPLTLPGAPTATLHAATKAYVDARVARAGDTMTGPLTLSGAPTANLHAATKAYVDERVAKAGDTMTGFLTLHADPTAAMHAVTKQYVDGVVTAEVNASGNAVDFVSLPSWANVIRIRLWKITFSANVSVRLLVGSGTFVTSGYVGLGLTIAGNANNVAATNAFLWHHAQSNVSDITGIGVLTRYQNNQWFWTSIGSNTASPQHLLMGVGDIALSGSLDRVSVRVSSGNFSGGSIIVECRR